MRFSHSERLKVSHPGMEMRLCFMRSAFSLVELLVSIAVICLLAALVFPLLKSVKARQDAAVCASNLHQIGVGMYLYAQDNGGTLPLIDYWRAQDPSQRQGIHWYTATAPYLGLEDHGLDAIWQCPPIRSQRPEGDRDQERPDYALNADLSLDQERGVAVPLRLSLLNDPGKKVMLFCSARRYSSYQRSLIAALGSGVGWGDHVEVFANQSHFCQIHNGRANVLFADGHVEPKTFPEINDAAMWSLGE